MTVNISPNIRKESARIDPSGNVIDARTKEVITPVQAEYVPPVEAPVMPPIAPVTAPIAQVGEMSVIDQIAQAKKHLAELEELKKIRIAEKKAELELLEQ